MVSLFFIFSNFFFINPSRSSFSIVAHVFFYTFWLLFDLKQVFLFTRTPKLCACAPLYVCVCMCVYAYVYFGHSLERLSCPFRWRPPHCCRCCCFVLIVTKTGHHLDCFMIFTFPDKYSLSVCVCVCMYSVAETNFKFSRDVRRTLNYLQRKKKNHTH